MDARPATVYGFPVEQIFSKGIGDPIENPVDIVLHTTETNGLPAYWNPIGKFFYPPHFDVSSGKIRQFRALDRRASTLRYDPNSQPVYKGGTNAYAAQVEIIGFTKSSLWVPLPGTMARLVAVVAYMSKFHNVPLVVPNPAWKDDGSDMGPLPWANRNSRRIWSETHWPNTRGVYEHLEVPGQAPTYHWDCGALKRSVVIAQAKALLEPLEEDDMTNEESARLSAVYAEQEGYIYGMFGKKPANENFTVINSSKHPNWAAGYARAEADCMVLDRDVATPI